MCVIMSKPQGVAFPEEKILKNCWDNNPDMGGFMYALNGNVYIRKGFKTWNAFKEALDRTVKSTGESIPYVLHFRISTQGYDTSCCQPFPLSGNMNKLKKRKAECNIGVAHNGVLSLTSDGATTYSDTMKFITDYLVNIVRSYDWYKDKRTCTLVDNLIEGSRFAILDKNGHCELRGKGWVEEYGCHFSNSSYSYQKQVYPAWWYGYDCDGVNYGQSSWWKEHKADSNAKKVSDDAAWKDNNGFEDGIDSMWDEYDACWNESTGEYNFNEDSCPYVMEDDDCYCEYCSKLGKCAYTIGLGLKKA